METRTCRVCGKIKELSEFSLTHGVPNHVCKDCVAEKKHYNKLKKLALKEELESLRQQVEDLKHSKLSDFKPVELMRELNRRGYVGQLEYIETHKIDISKI